MNFSGITKNKTLYASLSVLIFWYMLHKALQSPIIPNPMDVFKEFGQLLQKDLLIHLGVSLYRMFSAIGISVIIGVPLGLLLGMNEKLDAFISPIMYLLYPLPKIAFLPVLMILFGLGDLSKILLITSIIFFQVLLSTRDSVKSLNKELFYSIQSLGASPIQVYQHLILPGVLPQILTGLRVTIGISIAVLFFGENYATQYGIGYFIMDSWIRVDYVQMFAGILAISIMGWLLFKLIDLLEDKACKWIKFEQGK
ncbi:ABC transporter permease [Irregularibacter muris]|uniref:ABC transporter permease n=1 Tax=Irregularibacter muris TaxID=1796619 RepID=A0AAE3HFW2_9FIRM|nr:ABC transporter permease [Irregularibacter muris]MCR1899856.1 ABC transporter permease [Irregularibacter muris]